MVLGLQSCVAHALGLDAVSRVNNDNDTYPRVIGCMQFRLIHRDTICNGLGDGIGSAGIRSGICFHVDGDGVVLHIGLHELGFVNVSDDFADHILPFGVGDLPMQVFVVTRVGGL